jgi:4-carboxymuconolactone decarboxylase
LRGNTRVPERCEAEELKLHVKGALKNGLTKDEIKEILLQVAVYCGIPSGIDAFRDAREAFKEVEGQ